MIYPINPNKYNGWPETSQISSMQQVMSYDTSWEMVVALSKLRLLNKNEAIVFSTLRFDAIAKLGY